MNFDFTSKKAQKRRQRLPEAYFFKHQGESDPPSIKRSVEEHIPRSKNPSDNIAEQIQPEQQTTYGETQKQHRPGPKVGIVHKLQGSKNGAANKQQKAENIGGEKPIPMKAPNTAMKGKKPKVVGKIPAPVDVKSQKAQIDELFKDIKSCMKDIQKYQGKQ